MKKGRFLLSILVVVQLIFAPFGSHAMNAISQKAEEDTAVTPGHISPTPAPDDSGFQIYVSGDKVVLKTDKQIAGLQLETSGDWSISQNLLPAGWNVQKRSGRVIIYSLSDNTLHGKQNLFRFTGDLHIDSSLAGDRNGQSISGDINRDTNSSAKKQLTSAQVNYFKNYFDNLSSPLLTSTSTIIKADNIGSGPGSDGVLFRISMDNIAPDAAGVQFSLDDMPNWVYATSSISQVAGFSSYLFDDGTSADVLVVNLEGGVLPTGSDIPLVDIYLDIDPLATLAQPIDMTFSDLVVSDTLGNELVSDSVPGTITLGIKGDVNFDGDINILDIILAINFAIGLDTPDANELWAADMNSDSVINVLDVVRIVNASLIQGVGDLSVSLSIDTPATGIVPSNAARYPFTKIALTAGTADVTVDSLTVQRGGTAQDGAFDSIAILDASTMLPYDLTFRSLNASHQAVFSDDIVVPAHSTKYIILAGNMGNLAAYAGEAPTLGVTALTISGAGVVQGNFPIYGNSQNLNGSILIGSSYLARGTYSVATTTISLGTNDFTVFAFQPQVGSVESINFDDIVLHQDGTAIPGADFTNIELFRDTTKIADGQVVGSNIFFTSINQNIPLGNTYQYQVKADIVGGAAKSIQLGLSSRANIVLTGLTYGAGINPTVVGPGSSFSSPILSGNPYFILSGSLAVSRGNSVPSGNITVGPNQVLGAFDFNPTGEAIRISQLTLTVVSSSSSTIEDALHSVRLVDGDGVTVAGPTDITHNSSRVIFTDTFVVPVGTHQYRVVGDLASYGGWASDDNIYARINTPATAITATGVASNFPITATPSSIVDTFTQTIKVADLVVTRNTLPANSYVVVGSQDVRLGSWTFDATESGEDIRVTSIVFAASSSNATNLTVYDGVFGSGGIAQTPVNPAPAVGDNATSTFALVNPITITKGTSRVIELVGDIDSFASVNNSTQFGLTDINTVQNNSVVAYGVSTGNRAHVTLIADNGAVLTYVGAGAVSASTFNNPQNSYVRAGSTGVTLGNIKFDAIYEDLDLDQLVVYAADGGITGTATGNYQDITAAYIYNGPNLLATGVIPSTGKYTFNFPDGTLIVPQDGSVILTLKADFGTINQNIDNAPGTPAADVRLGLGGTDGFKFTGTSSLTTAVETYYGSTSSAMVLHKSIPTISYSSTASPMGAATSMINGSSDIFAFNVAADAAGSEVLFYRTSFQISTGGGSDIRVTNCFVKDNIGNIVGPSTNPTVLTSGGGKSVVTYVFNNPDISAGNTKEALSINAGTNKTYLLNCTVANSGSGDYISVSFLGDTASSTPAASHGTPSSAGQNSADAWGAYNQGNFVWSDNYKNRGLAVDGANATAWGQWYNGYLVSGLGTNTTGTPYSISW